MVTYSCLADEGVLLVLRDHHFLVNGSSDTKVKKMVVRLVLKKKVFACLLPAKFQGCITTPNRNWHLL